METGCEGVRIPLLSQVHSSVLTNENVVTQWPESASELYRPSDRRLSTKLVPTFADRGVSRGSPTAVIWIF
jgi:hypothetical protein